MAEVGVPLHEGIGLHRSQVYLEEAAQREGALGDIGLRGGAEQFLSVGRDIVEIDSMTAVGQLFQHSCSQVIAGDVAAVARTGDAVVGVE